MRICVTLYNLAYSLCASDTRIRNDWNGLRKQLRPTSHSRLNTIGAALLLYALAYIFVGLKRIECRSEHNTH